MNKNVRYIFSGGSMVNDELSGHLFFSNTIQEYNWQQSNQ